MDQGSLVADQITAGASLIGEFDRYAPLKAAFWLKESEDGQWFLYLTSDQINDSNFDLAYGEVIRITQAAPNIWLDPFQVKVTGVDDPVARSVIDLQQEYPSPLGTRLRNTRLGGLSVEEAYIYALPISTPTS